MNCSVFWYCSTHIIALFTGLNLMHKCKNCTTRHVALRNYLLCAPALVDAGLHVTWIISNPCATYTSESWWSQIDRNFCMEHTQQLSMFRDSSTCISVISWFLMVTFLSAANSRSRSSIAIARIPPKAHSAATSSCWFDHLSLSVCFSCLGTQNFKCHITVAVPYAVPGTNWALHFFHSNSQKASFPVFTIKNWQNACLQKFKLLWQLAKCPARARKLAWAEIIAHLDQLSRQMTQFLHAQNCKKWFSLVHIIYIERTVDYRLHGVLWKGTCTWAICWPLACATVHGKSHCGRCVHTKEHTICATRIGHKTGFSLVLKFLIQWGKHLSQWIGRTSLKP